MSSRTELFIDKMTKIEVNLNMLAGDTMAPPELLVEIPEVYDALKNGVPYDELLTIANDNM